MGYGTYSAQDWSKLKSSRNLSSDQDVREVYKATQCNPKFDPRHIGTRECFDSDEHPNTTPIVIGLDVTASMGSLAVKIATEALNDFIMKLYSTGAVKDPALMCAAYGDYRDSSPLQVTQFESDIRIAEQLLELYFENGGQGQVAVSCLWEFLARHTNIDAISKRNQKGFVFTIGDGATIRSNMLNETIKRVIGDDYGLTSKQSFFGREVTTKRDFTLEDILNEVESKFHVFHIMIGNGNPNILNGHKIVIGTNDIDSLPEIILSTIQLQKGKKPDEIIEQWDELKRPTVQKALSQLTISDLSSDITL